MSAHCSSNNEPDWLDVLAEQIIGDESSDSIVDSVISFAMKIRMADPDKLYELCLKEAQRRHIRENAIRRKARVDTQA